MFPFAFRRLPVALALLLAACAAPVVVPTPRPALSPPHVPTSSPTPTATPRPTRSPTPMSTPSPAPTPTQSPTPAPSPTPEPIAGALVLAPESDRLVPADGVRTATVVARLTTVDGTPAARRSIELRPADPAAPVSVMAPRRLTAADGSARFEVSTQRPGRVGLVLLADGQAGPIATLDVEFTRKVVVLAPGFQSALAQRFTIFGQPSDCPDAGDPRSINEALVCLGFERDVTILDMAWEDAACRPDEPVADGRRGDCIATISRTPDGRAVVWQPADYDLTSLVTSVVRQAQIDRWAQRLARTMVTYEQELHAVTGEHASFYLVGHSLGGQVVVRALRAILEDPWLRQWFADGRRGMLQAVVSIDGALNWAGAVGSLSDGPRCGLPVHTLPDESLEADNVRAVEAAYDAFGTLTVAMTSATDPIVGPDVALLRRPPPSAGYVEVIAHEDATGVDECSHSALLWPEPTGFPLNAVLIEHVGRAAGE